ncbi:MAG: ATP-dependent DNA helicase [Fibromonadaceae bacterium]|jgi:Rad3-related DNA helicase|nr:ATP-dependent DNA helicase [Fibromonadaceae bacterium]
MFNFTPRNGQLEYSKFAEETLKGNRSINLAEAETGIGRTFGYLAAALKVADEKPSERILIAVANKNLQKQIWEKDIPAIMPFLSGKAKPALFKERFGYVCLRKFNNCLNNAEVYLTTEERVNFFAIITWIEKTDDGDLSEVLHYNRTPVLWKKVNCEAASCLNDKCEHFLKCHFHNAKKKAENSNLLLVSHKLFLQDLQMDFAILPNYEKAIFDNAHKLPLDSQKIFGRSLHFYNLRNAIKQNSWCKKWEEQAQECEKLFLSLIKEIQSHAQKVKKRKFSYSQSLVSETGASPEPLQNSLRNLLEAIEQASSEFYAQNDLGKTKDCMQFASDIRRISSDIALLFSASRNDLVYWADTSSNPYQVVFNAELINISIKWSKSLYPILKSAFFTSDNISIDGRFDYLVNRLALRNAASKIFSCKSENEQSEVFATDFLPKPTDENFSAELVKTLLDILAQNKSSTLVFCDHGIIQKLDAEIKKEPQSKIIFLQGIGGNFVNLYGFFQKEAGCALIGTQDELKNLEDMELPENCLVVVARLPFPDAREPIIAKRMDILKEQNKNGFSLITMPETMLALRKIYNAILRSNKKQSLLLLDSRIASEQYGAKIQKLFPKFKILSRRIFSTNFFENN